MRRVAKLCFAVKLLSLRKIQVHMFGSLPKQDDTSEELNPESTQASLTSAPVHWGDPVRGGEKILLTLWFRQYPYREAAGNHCCDPPRAPRRSLHGGSVLRRVFK
mmetsp:Transcript_47548/g.83626  ORF Transcript_47548/g.83626 Transcript_47548/m.83626 type:complete len:105 (-) Transcript_47548:54-368(-)